MTIDRRQFLRMTASVGMIVAADGLVAACGNDGPSANTGTTTPGRDVPSTTGAPSTTAPPPTDVTTTAPVTTTTDRRQQTTRYGPLAAAPDANGLLLPDGFTSVLLATAGQPVTGTDHRWHIFPDGGACFVLDDGGWVVGRAVLDSVLEPQLARGIVGQAGPIGPLDGDGDLPAGRADLPRTGGEHAPGEEHKDGH